MALQRPGDVQGSELSGMRSTCLLGFKEPLVLFSDSLLVQRQYEGEIFCVCGNRAAGLRDQMGPQALYTPRVIPRSPVATLGKVVMRTKVPSVGAWMVSSSSP